MCAPTGSSAFCDQLPYFTENVVSIMTGWLIQLNNLQDNPGCTI